jgi:hypothetical protein
VVGRDVGAQLPRGIAGAIERGEQLDAGIDVLVAPLPLITGDADRQLALRGVIGFDQRLRGWHRHDDQDHHRDDRPDDFDAGIVQQRLVGDRALRLTELHQRIDHHAEHDDRDGHAPPVHDHVKVVDAARNGRDARRHVQRPGRERGGGRQRSGGGGDGSCEFLHVH